MTILKVEISSDVCSGTLWGIGGMTYGEINVEGLSP